MGIFKNKYVQLHMAIFLYTLSSVFSKIASSYLSENGLFSIQTIGAIGAIFFIFALYAIVWQQIIKKINLSIAYSNKGITIIWTLIWSVLLFGEKLHIKDILGGIIILLGIMVINYDK